ncbi:MAG: flagellar brake protein [Burkholderiaceae bacterium]|nr:flagellar brake protein [Burkholderiaceae bacterium]
MSTARPDTIHPDPVSALPADFRIGGRLAVRAILRELACRHVLVTLYADGRRDAFAITRLTHVGDAEIEFDLTGQEPFVRTVATARDVAGVAFPGQVKTQFRLDGFAVAAVPEGTVLRACMPVELYRIQRRDAFRVQPPGFDEAVCVRRLPPDGEVRYPLLDLSAGGASILLPAGEVVPEIGAIWPHCRLEAAGGRVIPCDLAVRHIDEQGPGSGNHRIGVAFHAMPGEVLRRIQVYVIDIEKRLDRRA